MANQIATKEACFAEPAGQTYMQHWMWHVDQKMQVKVVTILCDSGERYLSMKII